jgi:hypothetical protein
MVNKSKKGMNVEETYFQEDVLPLGIKEASIIVMKITKEKIVIN